jgi:predicted ester cyclase
MSNSNDELKNATGLGRRAVIRGAIAIGGATVLAGATAMPQTTTAVVAEREVSDNKELLRKAAQAFNTIDDRSAWFGFYAESVQAYGLGPAALDKAGMKNFYSALWGGFPDLTIHIDDLVGEGDKVVWRITVSGTHNGPFQGVSATGKSVKFGAHYTFRFEHGKIVERWSTIDRLCMLVQIGAVSLPFKK